MRIRNAMAALTLAAAPSAWADFETGHAAFDSGRFDEAPAERRAAADEGDGRAMPAPGRVHVRGGERFPRLSALPRDGRCPARTFHGGSADLGGGAIATRLCGTALRSGRLLRSAFTR